MDSHRARGLPPKLGIKKRKPRASAVVDVANGRARKVASAGPSSAFAGVAPSRLAMPHPGARGVSHLSKHQQAVAAKAASRSAGPAEGDVKRKGLRHFAVRVSRKVEEKSVTTYNEVADELVVEEKEIKQQEMEAGGKSAAALQKKLAKSGSLVDEKNIRRRVYDSLNVLMAMGIIEKDKKLISWRGLAMARGGGGHREAASMRRAIEERRRALEQKRSLFVELEEQATTLAALIRRNAQIAPRSSLEMPANPSLLSPSVDSFRLALAEKHGAGADASLRATGATGGKQDFGPDEPSGAEAHATSGMENSEFGGVASLTGVTPLSLDASPTAGTASEASVSRVRGDTVPHAVEAYANLLNKDARAGDSQVPGEAASDRIPIPFIIVATGDESQIELEMDQMREDVSFTFSSAFAVFDDREVLRRMNLASAQG
jgi:E2F/DP family winged-helix DNA-binding domain/Transcription factor DP